MSDEIMPYYNQELSYLRQAGVSFSLRNPAVAPYLRLGPNGSADPHVERMLEAFAYLTARVRHKIDDEFPELTDAIMGVLYPHFLAPIPSMSVVQMVLRNDQAGLTTGYALPRNTALDTDPIDGEPCRFRTCFNLTLWPLRVTAATFGRAQVESSGVIIPPGTESVLKLTLESYSEDGPINKLDFKSLRFFISGTKSHSRLLYELIFNHLIDVQACAGKYNSPGLPIGKAAVEPAGFAADEAALPYSARSFPGYRILTEYFTLPEKFLFVDIQIPQSVKAQLGTRMDLYLFLNRPVPELEHSVDQNTFRLGCTPIINLFTQAAEPIDLTHYQLEYRIVPDAHHPNAMEVYTVDRVSATTKRGEAVEYAPFFSNRHGGERIDRECYWHGVRRPAEPPDGQVDRGTEVFLSFTNLGFDPQVPSESAVDVEVTCLNRDVPSRLPFGGGQPAFSLREGGLVSNIECLVPPTATYRPPTGRPALWHLISHLNLNHLSITDEEHGAQTLRRILQLYARIDQLDTATRLDSIEALRSRRVVFRMGRQAPGAFCRGVEITLDLDETKFPDHGLYLFASVLERFFAMYCSVNTFTQLVINGKQRKGEICRWPPRAAEQNLL